MNLFQEEKEYFKLHETPLGGPWSEIDSSLAIGAFDSDIYPFLQLLNSLPFTYSAGMSCSGSLKDHDNKLAVFNCRYGINIKDPQGYCVIRADTSDSEWLNLYTLLTSVQNSKLTTSDAWERQEYHLLKEFPLDERKLFAYQIFTPNLLEAEKISQTWRTLAIGIIDIIQNQPR